MSWVSRFRAGGASSDVVLYRCAQIVALFHCRMRRTPPSIDRDDVAEETIARFLAFVRADSTLPDAPLLGWLSGIAAHVVQDLRRADRRHRMFASLNAVADAEVCRVTDVAPLATTAERLLRFTGEESIWSATERAVIRGRNAGTTFPALALQLGLSVSAVKRIAARCARRDADEASPATPAATTSTPSDAQPDASRTSAHTGSGDALLSERARRVLDRCRADLPAAHVHILDLAASGAGRAVLARELHVSETSARHRLRRILEKAERTPRTGDRE